jgi:hypothetical protein
MYYSDKDYIMNKVEWIKKCSPKIITDRLLIFKRLLKNEELTINSTFRYAHFYDEYDSYIDYEFACTLLKYGLIEEESGNFETGEIHCRMTDIKELKLRGINWEELLSKEDRQRLYRGRKLNRVL